uniref:Uncharacterized protein n=1 Tax=Meloidogyne enterolobii TaxID=390850 RepID=A0A6V7WYD5_MELEN|nr:unnamed protein product [Meloidogyne enterolobii]
MNITGKYICIDSYTNGSWIKLKRDDTNICSSHHDASLWYILETKENMVENNVTLDIPISLTQYIQVRYIFVNIWV